MKQKASFFNLFYAFINIGSLVASTVLVYVQEFGGPHGWTVGFAVPLGAMALSVLIFLSGTGRYKHAPVAESPIARVVRVLAAAFRNRKRRLPEPAGSPG